METQYYCTFKFYDERWRRLAVFIRYISPTEAELFTLTCSLADQFNKRYARKVYEAYLAGEDAQHEFHKPVIELVTIEPEKREVQTLLAYCNRNYYISIETGLELPDVPVLFNIDTEETIVGTIKFIN